ncbi:mitochondrial ribosomal protein L37-domain-containing protein [Boeremia exigua]|uniref:mitochondrial ribosomal protein L37-domain-containing protein n=1 Tax=Boeremia exigua TaxID=749465 RepID=UPI001E8CD5EE|nr:mitochondrial ribosomal protein L37-domain-containing protein [Boeremia exigua]KAH6637885.1 mitochondrial ribosomal protein L37-domain-containing protein [Boeremia exigua]
MICRTCLRASRTLAPSSRRSLSSTAALANATPISAAATPTPRQGSPTSPAPPAATSTLAAQPFSAPLTPAPGAAIKQQAAKAAGKKPTPLVKSSVPAGTALKGLNFEKNKQDPIALADDEYPAWLWTILQRKEDKSDISAAGDLFSKSKKQRRLAAKRLRKEQAMNPELLTPKIPLYEQTIDLPTGDGSLEGAVQAAGARGELTKSMRNKRRADIKETNFLKTMG